MESKRELAAAKFLEGYNCAQAVLIAFCQELGMDEKTAARLGSSLGGGMGQLREVCGVVSAMFLVAGMAAGYDDPAAKEEKSAHYARIRSMAADFENRNGSILCRELLKNAKANIQAVEHPRTKEFYAKRPCVKYVCDAAEQLEGFLQAHRAAGAGETP